MPRERRDWMLFLVLAATLAGCHREYYRDQADIEAAALIAEKSDDPRWDYPDFNIDVDPRSRYLQIHDPVRPPRPPDDPRSRELMQSVGGMDGYDGWDDYGAISELANPNWREQLGEYLKVDEQGRLHMRLEDAIKLALIHSPSYQSSIETLYLSALDVSTERFRFDVQFFGGSDNSYTHRGRANFGGESNTLLNNSNLQLRRKFASAGQLMVEFANQYTWQFSGPDSSVATSLLNFSIVQPLLRSGGRVVALETLTRAERTLLANLRAFQRYRKGFYTGLAIGDSGSASGPRRSGGLFGGTGLGGFSGQGAGGFGEVGSLTGFGGGRFGGGGGGGGAGAGGAVAGVAGGGARSLGGYIGLLQTLQELRNAEDNLNLQIRTLALLEASREAGLIGIDQVLSFEQSIETGKANLLQARNAFIGSVESFVRGNLGLPPDLQIVLDDTMIQPFQFIDPRVTSVETAVSELIEAFGEVADPTLEQLQRTVSRGEQLHKQVVELFKLVEADMATMEQIAPRREAKMTGPERKGFADERKALVDALNRLEADHLKTGKLIETVRAELKTDLKADTKAKALETVIAVNAGLAAVVGELALVEAGARLESITLEQPVRLTSDEALEIARAHRLDWMNARASLVDSWRLVEYNANALQSNVSIVFEGDMKNQDDNPFKMQGPSGSLRAGLQFDAPLTRLTERNNFRQQLISYERSRRQMIQFADGLQQGFRNRMRGLNVLEVTLENQRRQVKIAIRRVDQTRQTLTKPPIPGQPAQLGPTATQDLISALSALRDAQNNFMSVWLAYYGGRMSLMRDLGVMRVDENGLWVDESLEEALKEARKHPSALPPAIPEGGLEPEEVEAAVWEDGVEDTVFGFLDRLLGVVGLSKPDLTTEPEVELEAVDRTAGMPESGMFIQPAAATAAPPPAVKPGDRQSLLHPQPKLQPVPQRTAPPSPQFVLPRLR